MEGRDELRYWDEESIGDRISRLRRERNLSEDKLAAKTGLSIETIIRIEKGVTKAIGEYRDRIADVLGVTEGYLLNGEPYAERATMETVREMREAGQITDEEVRLLRPLISQYIKTRSNAKVPLNHRELESILVVVRG